MLQFQCRKCGFQAPSLEGHKCAPVPGPNPHQVLVPGPSIPELVPRLAAARAVLREVEERKEVMPLPTPGPQGFDRAAYQRAYMRGWRARRKEEAR